MKTLLTAVALTCALSSIAGAQGQARRDPSTVELVFKVDGMARVRHLADRRFARSDGGELGYDAYLPAAGASQGPRPAIIFIGGAPSVRGWRWYQDHGRIAAAQGFVALVPDKRFPRNAEAVSLGTADTAAFLDHLIANAETLNIDPRRMCLWVFSAGGRVAGLPFDADSPAIRCLVGFYPILDAAAGPVADPRARKIPTMIVRAGRDTESINASITAFVGAAVAANQPLTLINLPEADHGFEGWNDNETSRTAMRRAYAFITSQTGE